MNIEITFTENRAKYPNQYYNPIICHINTELPTIHNGGYNNYYFAEDVKWDIKGMEPITHDGELRRVKQYSYMSEDIEVHSPSGKVTGLSYYKTYDSVEKRVCTFFIQP
jgi:hypothetical protein